MDAKKKTNKEVEDYLNYLRANFWNPYVESDGQYKEKTEKESEKKE